MASLRPKRWWLAAVCGLAVSGLSGCQTWFPDTGQTLPSGRYLQHLPQYNPPSPVFPLSKEAYNLDQANIQAASQLPR
jgi:hypothetical protein